MNIIRLTLLAIALSVSACYAQAPAPQVKETRGFDVASYAPDGFIAAHIEISKDALTIFKSVPGPEEVKVISPPTVYKFTVEDKDGKHYVSGDFEIVVKGIDKDGVLIGWLFLKGERAALFYGVESDGSNDKLLANAKEEHQACVDVMKDDSDSPKTQDTPIVKEDSSVSKT